MAKTGGAKTAGLSGGVEELRVATEILPFDPSNWMLSVFRSLKSYLEVNIDTDIYEIKFGFPAAADLGEWLPFTKTIIHMEIDDIANPVLGFGNNIVKAIYDDSDFTITESEAQEHIINWDVGVWASAETGGVTARLQAYQILSDLFNGPSAYQNLLDIGIELRPSMNGGALSGGAFVKEEIDNISVFRVVNMTLVTRVYSEKRIGPTPYITGIDVAPDVTVSGEDVVITDNE